MTTRVGSAGSAITAQVQYYKNGVLADPASVENVSIYDAASGGTLVASGLVPTKIATGTYQITWTPDSSQSEGTYYDEWTATNVLGGSSQTIRYEITVIGAGTPARTRILLDLKSRFEAITIANGYKTDVTKVEPVLRSRDDVKLGERPYIGFGFDKTIYEHHMGNVLKATVPWTVVGYVSDRSWTAASAAINKLLDDIIAKIFQDETFGGLAIQTVIVDDLTDEADPDRFTGNCEADGSALVINLRTTFYRNTTST